MVRSTSDHPNIGLRNPKEGPRTQWKDQVREFMRPAKDEGHVQGL